MSQLDDIFDMQINADNKEFPYGNAKAQIKNLFIDLNKKAHDQVGDSSTESQEAFERLVAGL